MREIEIKVSLKDPEAALAALAKAGVVLSEPKEQHDVVYCLPQDLHAENNPSTNWLRIRTENGATVYFTLKRSVTGSLDSIEHETVVEKGDELAKILEYLGYVVYSDLTKIRRTGHTGDSIEICFDNVPPLGGFIELEKLCDMDVNGAAVERELFAVLDELGIAYGERMTRGYDELMNEYHATNEE